MVLSGELIQRPGYTSAASNHGRLKETTFNSSTTHETSRPPISPLEEAFEGLETLPVEDDLHPGARIPPRPKGVSFIPRTSPSKSPSRALSLPPESGHNSSLALRLEDVPEAHRAVSTMSKRSASSRKVQPVPLSNVRNGHRSSPSKQRQDTLVFIDEGEGEGEVDQSQTVPNPIGATQSMPELRESPERHNFPIAFLPNLIEHQKRTKQAVTYDFGVSSGEPDEPSSMSTWSHEYQAFSRYAGDAGFRPLTQAVIGENPPGIMVHSQSQSQEGAFKKKPTTLVVGTPSSTSESSQPERIWDSSQLYKEGRALFQHDSEEEPIPTQSIGGTQELVPTQLVYEAQTAHAEEGGTRATDGREASPPLIQALKISPAKVRGHHPSSPHSNTRDLDSGRPLAIGTQKIAQRNGRARAETPGLSPSKQNGTRSDLQYTPSKPVPVFPHPKTESTLTSSRSNPIRTSGSQNRDIDLSIISNINPSRRRQGPTTDALPSSRKLPPNPLKRNPLVRRRTPPDIDRYLFEKDEDLLTPSTGVYLSAVETFASGQNTGLFTTERRDTEQIALAAIPLESISKSLVKESFAAPGPVRKDEDIKKLTSPRKSDGDRSFTRTTTMTVHESLPEKATTAAMSDKTLVAKSLTVDSTPVKGEPKLDGASGSSTRSATEELHAPDQAEEDITGSSESGKDNASDYEPQEFQTQPDVLEQEAVMSDLSDEDESDALFQEQPRKRGAAVQGGRGMKRICRRKNSPKVAALMDHTATVEQSRTPNKKPILSPLDTTAVNRLGPTPSRRSTRTVRENRARTGSNAAGSIALGHLVMVRHSDSKRYYPGYAVERSGRVWQVDPCDGGVPVFAEPKHMRKCVFQEGDLIYVSPDGVGENIGDGIVVAVDERWEEERMVKIDIADEPGRYVAVKYLSVFEKHIKQWDSRKLTHKDLEAEDGVETMPPPTSTMIRSNSMVTPAKSNGNLSSIRIPQIGSNKPFFGAGFILSNCDESMAKRIKDRGGFIYNSWLYAYRFNGIFEKVKTNKLESRWIRRAEQVRGRNKDSELSPVQWIGDEIESSVKTIFVVAGKVATTAKNLIALALGVPIISSRWIDACEDTGERVDWIPYLLPSHNQPNPLMLDPELPGMLPLQMPDPLWGSPAYATAVLREILTHAPLIHRRLLLNKPMALYLSEACVQKLKEDTKGGKKAPSCSSPFAYLLLALGAQHVEAVEQHLHATDITLLKYDIIVVSDVWFNDIVPKKSKANKGMNNALSNAIEKGVMVISQSDLKLSIACGRFVKAPVLEKSSPTIDT
ncbi:hypothetical protein FRC17_009163 [Serendipita sp. 399]|nr:hypothetical protein FRC17_009163 [Serendipita sp. 399]